MEKVNLKPSVMPTERDICVLRGLYDNVVMSFPQIGRMYFQGKSKPTIINRLSKLEKAGLILKFKVPRIEVTGAKSVISVVYQISRSGILVLQKRHPEFDFRPEPIKLRPFSIDHDLLLVDVLAALKVKWPDVHFIHGELFSANPSHQGLKPDAILSKPNAIARAALELELTAKSEKRYRELVLKYRLQKEFSRVIYITSHQQIAAKIKAVIGPGIASERFEFLALSDVLLNPPVTEAGAILHQNDERKRCE
jgi:DNA-binding Lrp family transcriptional regulator